MQCCGSGKIFCRIRIRIPIFRQFRIRSRIRIRQKVPDPTGSGSRSTTLLLWGWKIWGAGCDDGQAVENDGGGVEEELKGRLLVGGGLQQVRLRPGQPAREQLHRPVVHVLERISNFKICNNGHLCASLRIREILVRIRIRGSIPLTNGSGFGSCYFRQWPSRRPQKNFFLLITSDLGEWSPLKVVS